METEYGDNYEPNMLGFSDGDYAYVDSESGYQYPTAIHENIHVLSSNNNSGHDKNGISIDGADIGMNEAITEMYTKRAMGDEYHQEGYSDYDENAAHMEELECVFGEEIIKVSYFHNQPELLSEKYDAVMGEGAWKELSNQFDESLHCKPESVEGKEIHKDIEQTINQFYDLFNNV